MIRVVVVDDHPVVCEGLVAVLSDDSDLTVVGQAGDGEEAIRLASELHPEVILMDWRLPGMSGTEACAQISEVQPSTRVIAVTGFQNTGLIVEAFSSGARGFLTKESDPPTILFAVMVVASGGTFIDPRVAGKLVTLITKRGRRSGPHDLTLMEMRVLELVSQGLSNREIARELNISEVTVRSHVNHAMKKLDAHDRTEAADIALRESLA